MSQELRGDGHQKLEFVFTSMQEKHMARTLIQYAVTVMLVLLSVVAHADANTDENRARERKLITSGMTEGMVFSKLGKPDHTTAVSAPTSTLLVVRWTYLPHDGDPQTVTEITLTAGRVTRIERTISR